jgi:hypothetical protein
MDEIAKTILSAKRKRFLRSRPVFERVAPVTEEELFRLATGLNFKFTVGLARWLLLAGYGDIDETLSFRKDCFSVIDREPLSGHISFAHDASGNRYAFNPKDGSIFCIRCPDGAVVCMAGDYPSFLRELIRHDYKLDEWVGSLATNTPSGGK